MKQEVVSVSGTALSFPLCHGARMAQLYLGRGSWWLTWLTAPGLGTTLLTGACAPQLLDRQLHQRGSSKESASMPHPAELCPGAEPAPLWAVPAEVLARGRPRGCLPRDQWCREACKVPLPAGGRAGGACRCAAAGGQWIMACCETDAVSKGWGPDVDSSEGYRRFKLRQDAV